MKYNTIIFDLDGTLLNTLEDLKDSLNYALTSHGYETRSLEEVRSFVGDGVEKLVERSFLFIVAMKIYKNVLLLLKNIISKICKIKPDHITVSLNFFTSLKKMITNLQLYPTNLI